jgi:predicted ribosome quality control (RQC) complex YloA/Tae2 family protein
MDVTQAHYMPVLHIGIQKTAIDAVQEMKLTVMLYREAPNIILRDGRRQKSLFPRCIDKTPKNSLMELNEDAIMELSGRSKDDFSSYLLKEIEGVDAYLAQELTPVLLKELRRILGGAPVRPRLVSVLPMLVSLFADDVIQDYRSFNDLYRDGIARFLKVRHEAAREAQKRSAVRNMKKRIARLQKKRLGAEAIEEYRIAGELILGNMKDIKTGMRVVRLADPYRGEEREITLDPRKTAQQNAQAYFVRYKKLKRGQPQLLKKIIALKKELHNLETTASSVKVAAKHSEKKDAVSRPFRIFMLASGAVVYVGKSARSNDELTFGFARPHDYFFHVRGYEGSHVILRTKVPKNQKPQKGDLTTAASIAAYFSKAKTQKNVPVSYTQRKYVKKNRKGKPGAAIMMREQVMFVDPGLPKNTQG